MTDPGAPTPMPPTSTVLPPLGPSFPAHRDELRRVATHVLTRARADAVGRIGLVPTPGGIGTPAFGTPATVVRLTATQLVVERDGEREATPLEGATLGSLAHAARVDLGGPLEAGADAPPLGDPDAPLALDPRTTAALAAWWAVGWAVLDRTVDEARAAGLTTGAARLQLWPEHFDGATTVVTGPDDLDRANLGASAGDEGHPEPYLYVGPWGAERPGGPAYWNAPFGATLGYEALRAGADPVAAGVAFLTTGLRRLAGREDPS